MPEAFDDGCPEGGVKIPAATLRERLPLVIMAVMLRARQVYADEVMPNDPVCMSFVNFVELIERLEAEGKNPRIIASY
jgi:hypothetical protein